jgi:hypothetical protein
MQFFAIIFLCVDAAILYGILHDQVTVRICIEYFTIGHPPIFSTDDPTMLAISWGILATWWVGFLFGLPLAVVARVGNRPKRDVGSFIRPFAVLLAVMAACALLAGIVGWLLAHFGVVFLTGPLASKVPADKHVPFIADLWAHNASYLVGFLGGIVILVKTWRSRFRSSTLS